jgi:drug/metabolite transporter (DMT)-like permease
MDGGDDRVALMAFLPFVLFSSGTAVAIRIGNRELAPLWGAGMRFVCATVILVAIMAALRLPFPKGRGLTGAAVYGALNFGIAFALFYYGLVHVHAGLGQTVLALVPLATLLLAVAHGQEKLRAGPLIGALVALAGVALLSLNPLREGVPLTSLLAFVGCAICMSEAAVIVRGFPSLHPVVWNAVAMLVGAVVLMGWSFLLGEPKVLPETADVWLAFGYTVVFGSVLVFVLFIVVLTHWTASRTAYAFVIIPVLTVLFSSQLDHEPLRVELAAGGLLVLLGVYIGALRPSRPAPAVAAEPLTPA